MNPKIVLVALAAIAGVCLPSHAQKNKKGQEKTAAVRAGKTAPTKVGNASGLPPMEFVVNTTGDLPDWNPGDGVCETAPANGQCTFRAAVAEANLFGSGSTITFASPLFDTPQTINLTGEVYISNIMTINGPGANKLTLSGRDANRVVYVYGGAELTIRDLTIADGWDGKNVGAGVYISEAGAILERVHIKDCYAVVGGGIYLEMGWMTMRQSAMTGNSADQGGERRRRRRPQRWRIDDVRELDHRG